MDSLELAFNALSAFEQASSEQDKIIALTQLRLTTSDSIKLIDQTELALQAKQLELKELQTQHLLYKRLKSANAQQIEQLKSISTTSENVESKVVVPLLHEYNISANEADAEEKITLEFNVRYQAKSELLLMEDELNQMKAAEIKMNEFLNTKWPQIKQHFEDGFKLSLNLESVFEEVNDEIDRACVGEAPHLLEEEKVKSDGRDGRDGRDRKRRRRR